MIRLLTLLTVVMASACSVLPKSVPVDLYQLPPPSVQSTQRSQRLPALRIDRPITNEALSGNRLLIMTADNQFQVFPNMRLAAPVPLLWRDWLLDAFWRDGSFNGLSAASAGLRSELELGGTLRAFYVDDSGMQPQAVIRYDATLISTSGRNIIASQRFEARYAIESVNVSHAVNSLGVAANQLARELIDWTVEQAQTHLGLR